MYRYEVETNYDERVPQTVILGGMKPAGIVEHWTAGGIGRDGALGTVRHFVNTRYTVNASYHVLKWWDPVARVFGAMWVVPPERAAHSMNPKPVASGGPYAPNAEVRRILGARVDDPNVACIAASFCGMPADLAAALKDPDYVDGDARLTRELMAIPSMVDRPLFNHGWAQPTTRYDAGEALIPALYAALEQEADMPTPALHYVPQLWTANAPGAELREQADTSAPVVATVPAGGVIFTLGEAQGDRIGWRVAVAGDPERLYYVRRAQITALPPTPRDPALYEGIAAVVNARAAGKPAPGGITPEQLAQAKRLAFVRGRDMSTAAYTAAGTSAAKAVPYQET